MRLNWLNWWLTLSFSQRNFLLFIYEVREQRKILMYEGHKNWDTINLQISKINLDVLNTLHEFLTIDWTYQQNGFVSVTLLKKYRPFLKSAWLSRGGHYEYFCWHYKSRRQKFPPGHTPPVSCSSLSSNLL